MTVSRWSLVAVASTLFGVAAIFLMINALWIPAKARLGQFLIAQAWAEIQSGERHARPWPWADTRPVGELSAPTHGMRHLVLDGASGRNLAWGPAKMSGSGGDWVISGHRDTHFGYLQELAIGDALFLETLGGQREFRVANLEVVDSRVQVLVPDPSGNRLTLVTCWPFDALQAGGPMRYVVTAVGVKSAQPAADFMASMVAR